MEITHFYGLTIEFISVMNPLIITDLYTGIYA